MIYKKTTIKFIPENILVSFYKIYELVTEQNSSYNVLYVCISLIVAKNVNSIKKVQNIYLKIRRSEI